MERMGSVLNSKGHKMKAHSGHLENSLKSVGLVRFSQHQQSDQVASARKL